MPEVRQEIRYEKPLALVPAGQSRAALCKMRAARRCDIQEVRDDGETLRTCIHRATQVEHSILYSCSSDRLHASQVVPAHRLCTTPTAQASEIRQDNVILEELPWALDRHPLTRRA